MAFAPDWDVGRLALVFAFLLFLGHAQASLALGHLSSDTAGYESKNSRFYQQRYDRTDLDHGAAAGTGVGAATQLEQRLPERVGHLAHEMEPDGVPVIDPLEWHPGNVRAENLLREAVHGLNDT